MKQAVVLLSILITTIGSNAQPAYRYDDLVYYRLNQFLRTPSVLLNAAAYKVSSGDTAGAINLVKQAATKNMYDTGFISGDRRVSFVTATRHWPAIKQIIADNRRVMSDPANMQVHTSDIDRFWKVFDQLDKPGADRLLMNNYIMSGTQGLRTFFEVRMGARVSNLLESVRKRRKYYESIRPVSLQLHTFRPRMIEAATKLKQLYPAAIFPPTTFSIGSFGAFGTADGGSGQLIGAEFLCDTNTAAKDELEDWQRSAIADTSTIPGILIHELIHIEQQTATPSSLLGHSINEGAADFITQLVLGYHLNSRIHQYGNAHEAELWEQFKTQMNDDKTDDWLYNGKDAKGRPGDLGYYMGFKICEAYYNKATDKKQAVKDILTIQDFNQFLVQSGYSPSR